MGTPPLSGRSGCRLVDTQPYHRSADWAIRYRITNRSSLRRGSWPLLLLLNIHQDAGAGGDEAGALARILVKEQEALAEQEGVEHHRTRFGFGGRKPERAIERADRPQARFVHGLGGRSRNRIAARPLADRKLDRDALHVG